MNFHVNVTVVRRVLNAIRHWVDNHWIDFESDSQLLLELEQFLETVKGRASRKYVQNINKIIERKVLLISPNIASFACPEMCSFVLVIMRAEGRQGV